MTKEARKKSRKNKNWMVVPYGQVKVLADEYRVSTVTMRAYLHRQYGPYSTAYAMQEMVRARVAERYK